MFLGEKRNLFLLMFLIYSVVRSLLYTLLKNEKLRRKVPIPSCCLATSIIPLYLLVLGYFMKSPLQRLCRLDDLNLSHSIMFLEYG